MTEEYLPGADHRAYKKYTKPGSEGRITWVHPDRIVHIKNLPEYQHYFSPRTTKGQKKALEKLFAERDNIRFEHNLEQGWTQREKNSRKPANKGEWRMLTNANGNPYLAPIGPAKGKFVMFDSWQSNDELMEIYKEAFEEEWVPGKKVRGVYEFVDPHQHFEEPDGGHIIRIDYHSKMEVMMVHFRNKDSVVCYLSVPQTTIDLLRECVGKKDGGREPPHNHLLGVRFWDLVRMRGSQTGGNCPFYYIEGGPSGTFVRKERNPGIAAYNAKRRSKILEEEGVQTEQSLAASTVEDSWSRLEEIIATDSFKKDYDSGKIEPLADFADDIWKAATASWKEKAELLKNNKDAVKELLESSYAEEVQKAEEEGAMKVHSAKLAEDREMMNRDKKKQSGKKNTKKQIDDYNDDDDLDASFFDIGGREDDEDDWF